MPGRATRRRATGASTVGEHEDVAIAPHVHRRDGGLRDDFGGLGAALEARGGQGEVSLAKSRKLLFVFDGDCCSDELLESGADFLAAGGDVSAGPPGIRRAT
jgi:hypothetical protein